MCIRDRLKGIVMKKVCVLILLGLVIISTGIYQYYYQDSSPNNIVIMDESHELVDTSINESISNRILAVYLEGPYYYYLGYDGIGRYDIKNHKLDVWEFTIYGDETEQHKLYHPRSKMTVNKKNNLEEMCIRDSITSTGAPHYIITEREAKKIASLRKGEPIVMIDIAVPRDIDPGVADMEGIYLFNIDSLESVVEENKAQREEEARRAEPIIHDAIEELLDKLLSLTHI